MKENEHGIKMRNLTPVELETEIQTATLEVEKALNKLANAGHVSWETLMFEIDV